MNSNKPRSLTWHGLERPLRQWPLLLSLLLAFGFTCVLGSHGVISEQVMPFGDGMHYTLRALALYGCLHSGQWSNFWNVFTLPRQSLAPLHYWLFFLVPPKWASVTSYGWTLGFTTYGLLALGIWALCLALERAEWSPALFLLCACQNISLDANYFYFADIPFFAMGTVVLAGQVRAWRDMGWCSGLVAGAGTGLMFWVKPANASIFTATFLLAELFWLLMLGFTRDPKIKGKADSKPNLVRHVLALASGFVPVYLMAMMCGGLQSIIRLINANEVTGFMATKLECTGLLRLFYFPLCLTFFYHTIALLIIFSVSGALAFKMNRGLQADPEPLSLRSSFPDHLFIPLLSAYLVLGEFFSFGMEDKEMRSLLLVLPIVWISVFWAMEALKVRLGLVLGAATTYVLCAFSQILFGTFETTDVSTQGYQLKEDWLERFPPVHVAGAGRSDISTDVLSKIRDVLPEGAKIAVGSEQLYVTSESLTWTLQHTAVLHGVHYPFQFENFLSEDGRYCRSALRSANAVVVYVHPSLQYSPQVMLASMKIIQFSADTWSREGVVSKAYISHRQTEDVPMTCLIVLKKPLTDSQVTELIAATHGVELPPTIDFNFVQHEFSWAECTDVLWRWEQKRLGK